MYIGGVRGVDRTAHFVDQEEDIQWMEKSRRFRDALWRFVGLARVLPRPSLHDVTLFRMLLYFCGNSPNIQHHIFE
jgi:hypothetical protein